MRKNCNINHKVGMKLLCILVKYYIIIVLIRLPSTNEWMLQVEFLLIVTWQQCCVLQGRTIVRLSPTVTLYGPVIVHWLSPQMSCNTLDSIDTTSLVNLCNKILSLRQNKWRIVQIVECLSSCLITQVYSWMLRGNKLGLANSFCQ